MQKYFQTRLSNIFFSIKKLRYCKNVTQTKNFAKVFNFFTYS